MLLIWIQVEYIVKLNTWYKGFYDILQKADDIDAFWGLTQEFLYITLSIVILAVSIRYLTLHYAFRWRQAITYYYLPYWHDSPDNIEGSSQRIQEDTYDFARYFESIAVGMFKALLTLLAFVPILWDLSEKVVVPWLKGYQGSLVWIALFTSVGGLLISYVVAIKLPGLEYENQKVEAAYRKQLVYGEDDINSRDLPTLYELFMGLRKNYFRIFNHYSYYSLWSNVYAQAMVIVPYLLMAPSLFTGVVALGTVTQTGNAFGKVNDSFSYLIDNWTDVTKFMSVIKRLKEFERNIVK